MLEIGLTFEDRRTVQIYRRVGKKGTTFFIGEQPNSGSGFGATRDIIFV
jgi:hypothetical protein